MGNFNRGGRSGGSFSRGGFGGGRGGNRPTTMYKAICSECGDSCEIPFKPTGTRPVFCSVCFGKQQDNDGGRSNDRGGDRGGRFGGDRRESRSREDREMHDVICDKCGKNCQVPFKPTPGKEIFCDECFGKTGKRGGDSTEVMEQIKMLTNKIDKLITLLDPKASVKKEKEVEIKKVVKEKKEKAPAKKAVAKKKVIAKKKK